MAGWAAVATGAFDFFILLKKKHEAYPLAMIHGMMNTLLLFGYTLWAMWLLRLYPQLPAPSTGHLVVKICLVVMLVAGNFLGGTLVFKYKTGIEK